MLGQRSRDVIRQWASQQALDLLRRMILGQPVPDARLYSPEEVEQSRQTPFES